MESLAAALLDHDPDILVVEDVSESRSFKIAAKAAMRGKLAVCGLSFSEASGALEYLHYIRHDYPILFHIKGIVSVKGVRLLCPLCKQNYVPTAGEEGVTRRHFRNCLVCSPGVLCMRSHGIPGEEISDGRNSL